MSDIIIYEDGAIVLDARVENESVWLSQKQMAQLFEVDSDTVSYHLKNIYKSGELGKDSTTEKISVVQKEGKREVKRNISFYNLDAIISVGYRVNSKKATQFRIWSTNILKQYILKGYALNKTKLQQQKLEELDKTIKLIKQGLQNQELSTKEAKAANLLYYIIKGHPFNDGNKRIGAYLFVLFLHKNGILHKPDGEPKINDNALASIALLVAQSDPIQKDIIIKLVMNMLYDGEV